MLLEYRFMLYTKQIDFIKGITRNEMVIRKTGNIRNIITLSCKTWNGQFT